MFKITQKFLLLFLVVMLCVFAGNAGAEDELLWKNLMCKDWLEDTPDAFMHVGDVSIENDNDVLKIKIYPNNPNDDNNEYKMSKIAIHVAKEVNCESEQCDDDDFYVYDILDRKNMPRPKLFDYQTNNLKEFQEPQDYHEELIEFSVLEDEKGYVRWDTLYIVVYVVLQEEIIDKDFNATWVDLPEKAMAEGVEFYPEDDGGNIWGWYVEYTPTSGAE